MKTKTDGGHDIDEKDLEEMRAEAGKEDEAGGESYALEEYTGTCRFCGQMGTATGKAGLSEMEINELVTCRCGCDKAKEYAKQKEQIQKAKARIAETFGPAAGEEKALDEAIVNNLISFVDIIAEKKMQSVTVDIGRGLKARVSRMAKGSIKVERTETVKASYEE